MMHYEHFFGLILIEQDDTEIDRVKC